MRPTRTPSSARRARVTSSALGGALTVLAALVLAGCGSVVVASGGPTSGGSTTSAATPTAGTTTPTTTTSSASTSSTGTSTPTATVTPPSGDPTDPVMPVRSGPASVVGTVTQGVEPRCLLVGPYVLTGTESLPQAEQALLTAGTRVAVTGTVDPGMASYCQQGTLLTVRSVHAVRPMGPGPQATPTVFTTP
ncbi:hypothetical protein [Lapillicoccus jejuensis]|uniref:Uncharacterized protein n=1 Tax=Lapillicoccus jejuensis TaxID=402171 RepID=A0A542DY53_9MICO|nr:hypothetical protein [Lapillicoccus jejuensis]TQJ08030.1 hypothetical protein FB458_1109 [Lapillicoccus jejuensis]